MGKSFWENLEVAGLQNFSEHKKSHTAIKKSRVASKM
jgi:hypothetical protein